MALSQRVFHQLEPWPNKDANSFMVKYVTFVPDQKKELKSGLIQNDFLKEFECVPGYKAYYKFKTYIQSSQISQGTNLVPLFKLDEKVIKIII